MTGTSCSLPSSKEDDSPELTHIFSVNKRRHGVNRATSVCPVSETAAAPSNMLPVRSNLGSFVDHLFKYHYPCDHEDLPATRDWGGAAARPAEKPKNRGDLSVATAPKAAIRGIERCAELLADGRCRQRMDEGRPRTLVQGAEDDLGDDVRRGIQHVVVSRASFGCVSHIASIAGGLLRPLVAEERAHFRAEMRGTFRCPAGRSSARSPTALSRCRSSCRWPDAAS